MLGLSHQYWGYTAVVLAACFFAQISILTKFAYSLGMTPWQILTLQSLVAFLVLYIYMRRFKPELLKISDKMLVRLLVYSIVGSLTTSALSYYALLYLPASLSIMLLFTYPALVVIGAYLFFHQRVLTHQIIALLLTLAGTMLSTRFWQVTANSLQFKGILFGLGSALAYAFFNLYGEHILAKTEPLTTLVYVQFFSALALIGWQIPAYLRGSAVLFGNLPQLLLGIVMATLTSLLPFWLLLEGIKQIGSAKASIIGSLELPATFLLAFIFLHEKFNLWQAIGAGLILTGILLIRYGGKSTGTLTPDANN
ncbi:MAG TPA: DMT family transporter [Desulfobacteria bacterium]|nr:DMT family transporter [Desulfobacteria bacterium]